jgi:hypothetical protein
MNYSPVDQSYTPLDQAYKIHHTNSNTYTGSIKYNPTCIFCSHQISTSLMNDGGSFRRCNKCNKHFRASIVNDAITNYSYSTHHLKGTN